MDPGRVIRIDHGVVSSNDVGRSLSFFIDVMGARFERIVGVNGRGLQREVPMLAFFTLANHHGFGVALQSETIGPRTRPLEGPVWGFELDQRGIEGAMDCLKQVAVPFEGPFEYPPPSPIAASIFVSDPFDYVYELCARRSGKGVEQTGQGHLGLRRISHVRLDVTDLERAQRWYTEVLGTERTDAVPGEGQITLVIPGSGQLFILREVPKMPLRSLFYRGQHVDVRVSPGQFDSVANRIENPERYQGHVSTRIPWPEANAPTVYFYDPFYNRLQLSESDSAHE